MGSPRSSAKDAKNSDSAAQPQAFAAASASTVQPTDAKAAAPNSTHAINAAMAQAADLEPAELAASVYEEMVALSASAAGGASAAVADAAPSADAQPATAVANDSSHVVRYGSDDSDDEPFFTGRATPEEERTILLRRDSEPDPYYLSFRKA